MIFTFSLKKNQDFKNVYNKKKSKADKNFVMYINKNGLEINRLGISISKKVGNSVVRHRIKRLIKESYRKIETSLQKGYDIVIIARKGTDVISSYETLDSLLFLSKISGIKKKKNSEKN